MDRREQQQPLRYSPFSSAASPSWYRPQAVYQGRRASNVRLAMELVRRSALTCPKVHIQARLSRTTLALADPAEIGALPSAWCPAGDNRGARCDSRRSADLRQLPAGGISESLCRSPAIRAQSCRARSIDADPRGRSCAHPTRRGQPGGRWGRMPRSHRGACARAQHHRAGRRALSEPPALASIFPRHDLPTL